MSARGRAQQSDEPRFWFERPSWTGGLAWPARPHPALKRAREAILAAIEDPLRAPALGKRAARWARGALERDPRCWAAYELAAVGHALQAENWEARALMRRACSRLSLSPAPALFAARVSCRRSVSESLGLVDRVLRAAPEHPFAGSFKGELLRRAGRPRQALAWLERGLALGGFARAVAWRGLALADLGEESAGLAELARARARAPWRARLCALEAERASALGLWRRAASACRRSLDGEARAVDVEEALEAGEPREELRARLYFLRFAARGKLQDPGCLDDLEAAHRLDPKFSWTGCSREGGGLTLRELDGLARLARSLRGALEGWRGLALLEMGELEAAEDSLKRAAASAAPASAVQAWLSRVNLRLGREEAAWRAARRAIAQTPSYAPAYGALAELELRRGSYGKALRAAERSLALYPHSAWGHALRAEALLALERFGLARAALDEALALDERFARAYLLRALTRLEPRSPAAQLSRAAADARTALRLGADRAHVEWVLEQCAARARA